MPKNARANQDLLWAAKTGKLDMLERALAGGAEQEARDPDGCSAAILAAYNGHEPCLVTLIAAGANLEATALLGWTAAMSAAAYGHQPCLRALIDAGANLETTDKQGHSAAGLARRYGHSELASLIEATLFARSERELLDSSAAPPNYANRIKASIAI